MPILEPNVFSPPTLSAIHEVRVDIPIEQIDDATRFYADVLCLPPWPSHLQPPGTRGFGDWSRGLLLCCRHAPIVVDPARRRLGLLVASLDHFQSRLTEHAIAFERFRGFFLSDDVLALYDPVGHRIEARQSRPL